MKVKELKDALNLTNNHDEDELMIRLQMPSVGPIAMSSVERVYFGFDWEHGKTIINPTMRLSEKTLEEDVYHKARDLLMYLATKPSKRESYETSTAKRILIRSGSKEEDFEKYRKFFHKEKT